MIIYVTQEHIDKGNIRNQESCPIAHAIISLVHDWVIVRVHRKNIFVRTNGSVGTHISPNSVIDFIDAFDNRQRVVPFSFELDIPNQFLK